jgi:chromosome segregation protein
MYLKRLEIKGFKSFAERTVLDFLPIRSGKFSITAIVGPNGAGKSNISDAVRWVMGEQSLKNLRGKKNEDVIFNGSESKGQLGAAEVVMILDNNDAKILPDYPEITVARRLYRSGEGEYLINNNPVRLLDIHLLLARAQFAQHSYSVVGQGMIDRLLSIGPAERKDFLDEASGIKEYQIKQHQADLKLERTKENIEQAGRLMQEVEPRLKILARQVKKLEKRQEVELKLREYQEQYYSSLFLINKRELDNLGGELEKVDGDYRVIFKTLEEIQTELARLAKGVARQDLFNELQLQYQALSRENNDLERQMAVKEGQMRAEYNVAGKQNISWIQDKLAGLKSQFKNLSSQLAEVRNEGKSAEQALAEERNLVESCTRERNEIQLRISQLEGQMLQDQSEQNYRQAAGLSAVQAVLENKEKFGKVYGLVAELAEVDEKYRVALEVAAGSYLTAIVVADDEVARKAIEFLRENRLGVATFLPVNKISDRRGPENENETVSQPGVCGYASELVKHDEKFDNVFSFVFGQTIVVETLPVAQRIGIGKNRIVTLAGDLMEKSGAMRGGYRFVKKGALGFAHKLNWSQEKMQDYQVLIAQLKQNLTRIDDKQEAAKASLLKAELKKEAARTREGMLDTENKKLEQEIAGLEQELALLNVSPEEFGEMLSQMQTDKIALEKEIKTKAGEIEAVSEKINRFNQEEEDKKQRVFSLQDEMQKKQSRLNEILSVRNDLKIRVARLETRQESITEEVRAEMGLAILSIIERKPPEIEPEKLEEFLSEIQKLKYQLSLIGGIDEEVVADYQQTKERFEFLSGQISDLNAAIVDLEKMIVELDEVMKKKRSAAFKKIRKEFDRYAKILFGGGSADIYEIYGEPEEEEMLAEEGGEQAVVVEEAEKPKKKEKILTGIDIMVNPPGKKIKNINTLSGGERTLASIALICAVLNFNPSPFVVLDEVEAALDETNTRRFAQILSELSSQSQFIIITHNRVTMHSADALYGVVMSGDGVSRLLSVKMEEAGQYQVDK